MPAVVYPASVYQKELITTDVVGAPFDMYDIVSVKNVIHGLPIERKIYLPYVGREGIVEYFDYTPPNEYPALPLIGVSFGPGEIMEFWPDELISEDF